MIWIILIAVLWMTAERTCFDEQERRSRRRVKRTVKYATWAWFLRSMWNIDKRTKY